MKGKEKCRMLKQIRKKIADENDIPYVVEECPFQGDCKGTCPKCEAELRKLEEELSLRRRIGKKVAVAGLAAGMIASTTACTPADIIEAVEQLMNPISYNRPLDGVVAPPLEGEPMPIYPKSQLTGDVIDPDLYNETEMPGYTEEIVVDETAEEETDTPEEEQER